jgi:hypothetical protein
MTYFFNSTYTRVDLYASIYGNLNDRYLIFVYAFFTTFSIEENVNSVFIFNSISLISLLKKGLQTITKTNDLKNAL